MLAFMTQSVYNEVSIRFTEKLHLGVCVCVFWWGMFHFPWQKMAGFSYIYKKIFIQ